MRGSNVGRAVTLTEPMTCAKSCVTWGSTLMTPLGRGEDQMDCRAVSPVVDVLIVAMVAAKVAAKAKSAVTAIGIVPRVAS